MNILRNLLMATAIIGTSFASNAADDLGEPAVTIKTEMYNEQGPTNNFSILLSTRTPQTIDIDMGFGSQEVDVVPAYIEDGAWKGTFITCRVSQAGEIKIYGDPSQIDVINASGAGITEIGMANCLNLEVLDLSHNYLKGLDLTPFSKLMAIYLSDNPGTAQTPIKIGGPKNDLAILEVDIIDYIDPNFDLSLYPNLTTFDAYATKSLKKADLSNSSKMVQLVLEMTSVETIDLSGCPNLAHLNVSESRISQMDLSVVPKLQRLLCGHASGTVNTDITMPHLDLTHNPQLNYLAAQGNDMESLDITKNPLIQNLYLQDNKLTTLDLSQNKNLVSVNINNNNFTFSTLPTEQNTWLEYFYNQRPYAVNKSYAKGTEIDFSAMIRPGTTTTAKVMCRPIKASESEDSETEYALPESEYTFSATGKLVVNKTYTDSLYVVFSNSAFVPSNVSTGYSLYSSPFMVKEASEIGQPSPIISFMPVSAATNISFKVGMDGATSTTPRKLLVDFGDGNRKEFNVTSSTATTTISSKPTAGKYITLYAPENEIITAFEIADRQLVSIDITKATELRTLSITGCSLGTINLAYNRCLTKLDLSRNNLKALDLKGVRGDYEKYALSDVKASDNKITDVKIINTTGTLSLDLGNNLLAEFALKDYDNLQNLDLSGNKLSTIMLSYMGNVRKIDLSRNQLTQLENMVEMPFCTDFNVSDNKLTLETLPYFETNAPANYVYAPQQALAIPSKGPGVNLSKQNRVINGVGTTYVWKTVAGQTLVNGTDYRITDDGATRFLNTSTGPVYCEMTNPAFPAFTGANVFRTTEVTPMGAPQTLVATFTTPKAVKNGSLSLATKGVDALYIDWRGDDTDFVPYETKDTYTLYSAIETYAGAQVKVYTYNSPDNVTVFSVSDIPMSTFDGSYMTSLINFTLDGSGISPENLVWPSKETISELFINNGGFTEFDLSQFPALTQVGLAQNKLTSIDLSKAPKLELAAFNANEITSVKFNNPNLWFLDLTSNKLTSIDLNGMPIMQQLVLSHNQLSTIDLTPVKNTLRALLLVGNHFRFTTLPVPSDYPLLEAGVYHYGKQSELEAEIVDMKVDLSSQAVAAGTPTVYRWFLDGFEINPDTGMAEGEELIVDDEYTVENGVTTFAYKFDKPVQAVLTNEAFPNLYLQTGLLYFDSAIEAVEADGGDTNAPVNVYNLQGVAVRTGVLPAEALDGLAPGIYIVAGKKVLVR